MDQGQTNRNRKARAIAIQETAIDARRQFIAKAAIAAGALTAALPAAWVIAAVTKLFAAH